MKRHSSVLLILLGFILTSCLEAEVDIDLKRDGSGEMRMKILPIESSLNPIINELENDLKTKENYKDSDLTKRTESDGRVSLSTRKRFKRVEEVDENCKFVSHKDYDEFKMRIPNDFLGIVKKIKVNMPGRIIESNVKNFEGKSVIWNRTLSAQNRLIIKSKPSEPIGDTVLILVIVLVAIGVVAGILIFMKIQKPEILVQEVNFCPQCGTKGSPDDNFCQNCGQKLR